MCNTCKFKQKKSKVKCIEFSSLFMFYKQKYDDYDVIKRQEWRDSMLIQIREILNSDMRLLINEVRSLIRSSQNEDVDNNILKEIRSKLNSLKVI